MLRIVGFLLVLAVSVVAQISDQSVFNRVMAIEDAGSRAQALEKYLQNNPEVEDRDRVQYRIFSAWVEAGNESNAVRAAKNYIGLFPENGRRSVYNSVAWTLAEANMGLDLAKECADAAVRSARKERSPRLNMILDTQAYVYYRMGEFADAEKIQLEAMKGQEDDPDYASRLALYLYANGKTDLAIETAGRTLLAGGDEGLVKQFDQWIRDKYGATDFPIEKQKIVRNLIKGMLNDPADVKSGIPAVLFMALTKVDLDKAQQWAEQFAASVTEQTPANEKFRIFNALAKVYFSQGKFKQSIRALKEIESRASLFDSGFWYMLGSGYENTGEKDKAVESYLNGMVIRKNGKIQASLERLLGGSKAVAKQVAARKDYFRNFDPGHYKPGSGFKGRVVLAELFTGAECGPCQAADLGMDAIAEFFPRTMVAILEYHLHIPGPDPMTNAHTFEKYRYYGQNFGTPTVFINGRNKLTGGGPAILKKNNFDRYRTVIENYLSENPQFNITTATAYTGDQIDVTIGVKNRGSVSGSVTLQAALVEKHVDYPGGNGINRHAFVVRHLLTGAEGIALSFKNGKAEHNLKLKLETVESRIKKYLDDFEKQPPRRYRGFAGFRARPEKLDRKNLALVLWIQDAESREVYQTVFEDLVPGETAK